MPGKNITQPVGMGGVNYYVDVMTVQYLLNCVPVTAGGPMPELDVDGIAGALTCQAIRSFQKVHFGWQDGRVDPESRGGVTIVELKRYDPDPFSTPFTPASVPGRSGIPPRTKKQSPPQTKKHSGIPRTKRHSGVLQ